MMNRRALLASLLVGVLAVAAPVTLGNFFRLSSVPTADLPPAASVNTGALVYDSTSGSAKLSNGVSWKALSAFDNDGGVTAIYPTRSSSGVYGLFVPLDAGTIDIHALARVQFSTDTNSSGVVLSGPDVYLNGGTNYISSPLEATSGTTARLQASIGAGASDVAVKVGTTVSDGSTNANTKLWSVRTGLGGTEVEYFSVQPKGSYTGLLNLNLNNLVGKYALFINNTSTGAASDSGAIAWLSASSSLKLLPYGMLATSRALTFTVNNNVDSPAQIEGFRFISVQNPTRVVHRTVAPSGQTAAIAAWMVGTDDVATFAASGRLDQSGTDSSASAGAATIDKPSGKSALASGATTVTITNSNVAAGDQVFITWHGDLGTQSKIPWVTTAAGSFTVNVGTAPGTNVPFCWTVAKRL